MVMGHIDLPLDRIAAICRRFKVKELKVFGSALREDFRSESDVDLLVDFLPHHGLGILEYLECQEELGKAIGRRVVGSAIGIKTHIESGDFGDSTGSFLQTENC